MRGRGAQTWEELLTNVRIERNTVHGLDTDCWSWYGRTNDHGYGIAYIKGYSRLFHRYVWERMVGTIPDKLELDHLCRNRRCCNPDHLEAVTRELNQARVKNPVYRKKADHELGAQMAELLGKHLFGEAS